MVCFADINVSQGSVANMQGALNYKFTKKFSIENSF